MFLSAEDNTNFTKKKFIPFINERDNLGRL